MASEIGNIGYIGMTPLAETGMVTVGVAHGADVAPMDDEDVDIRCDNPISTEIWCRGGTSIRNDLHDQLVGSLSCDPIDLNYTMPADDHKELFGNFLSGQMCPVINDMTDW